MSLLQTKYDQLMAEINQCKIHITVNDFSHDSCGNPTAHYIVRVKGKPFQETKKRKQIGYSGNCLDGAFGMLASLDVKIADYTTEVTIGSRSSGQIDIYMNEFWQ